MNSDNTKHNKKNPWNSRTILDSWAKKKSLVEVYTTTGAKIKHKLMSVNIYDIVLWDDVEDKKYIIFKSNIFYISKVKEDKNASVQ